MFKLTPLVPGRTKEQDKVQYVVTDISDANFPIVLWFGECVASNTPVLKRIQNAARKALKEIQPGGV